MSVMSRDHRVQRASGKLRGRVAEIGEFLDFDPITSYVFDGLAPVTDAWSRCMSFSALSTASSGIQRNLASLDAAAERIAYQPLGTNTVKDLIDMKVAKHGVAANAAVVRTADEMLGTLVDILA